MPIIARTMVPAMVSGGLHDHRVRVGSPALAGFGADRLPGVRECESTRLPLMSKPTSGEYLPAERRRALSNRLFFLRRHAHAAISILASRPDRFASSGFTSLTRATLRIKRSFCHLTRDRCARILHPVTDRRSVWERRTVYAEDYEG